MRDFTQEQRVIIIGAGASGISAARTLLNGGVKPLILEARDRLGGRLCKTTFKKNLTSMNEDSEVTIQLGANWIHGLDDTVNPLYAVAKKLNLGLHPTSPDDYPGDDVLLYSDAKCSSENEFGCSKLEENVFSLTPGFQKVAVEDYKLMLNRYLWIVENISSCELCTQGDASLALVYEHLLKLSESAALPFGICSDLHKRCINWCFDRVCIDFALPLEEISVRYFIGSESDGEFGEALVEGGFYRIFQQLVDEINDNLNVKFNCKVVKIEHDYRGVSVTCSSGEVIEADAVIVTTPVGVLQSGAIQFTPRPLQLERLCSLKFGIMNLVWLWFPYQFWPAECNYLGVARGDSKNVKFSTFLIPPMKDQYGNPQAILMAETFGDFAVQIESMPDEEIARLATEALRTIFGNDKVPNAVGCSHSAWRSDEFARGSWSCPGISGNYVCPFFSSDSEEVKLSDIYGTDSASRDEPSVYQESMSDPQQVRNGGDVGTRIDTLDGESGRVYFAGEATNYTHQGTAHGAYISGIKAGAEVLKSFGIFKESAEYVYLKHA